MKYLLVILAIICGAVFPLQAGLNNKLTKVTLNPIVTTFFSVMISFLTILIYALFTQQKFPSLSKLTDAPFYVWFAGMLGTLYVASIIYLVPRLGLAFSFSLVVAGQMAMSLFLDHYGVFGIREPITSGRIVGTLFIVIGVIVMKNK